MARIEEMKKTNLKLTRFYQKCRSNFKNYSIEYSIMAKEKKMVNFLLSFFLNGSSKYAKNYQKLRCDL